MKPSTKYRHTRKQISKHVVVDEMVERICKEIGREKYKELSVCGEGFELDLEEQIFLRYLNNRYLLPATREELFLVIFNNWWERTKFIVDFDD